MQLILQDTPFARIPSQRDLPIQQRPIWADLCKSDDHEMFVFFRADQADRVLATGVMQMRRLPVGLYVASLQRGPAVEDPADLPILLPQLEEEARARGAVTLSVNPHFTGGSAARAASILRGIGYLPVSRELQRFPSSSAVLDLNRNDDAMLTGMTDSCRKQLRYGRGVGAEVSRMTSHSEAEAANRLLRDMLGRRGLNPKPQQDFHRHLDQLLANPTVGAAVVARQKGEIFGAAVCYVEGQRGYNILMTTRNDDSGPWASMLIWETARQMRDLGCTQLDLMGDVLAPSNEEIYKTVKRSFGTDAIALLPVFAKPLRHGLHQLATTMDLLRRRF